VALFNEYEAKRKKTSVGYLLWLIGFHYLYYRRSGCTTSGTPTPPCCSPPACR
jgi:hypothetical protein